MDKYADFSDEELIVKLRNGDKAITDYIMDKYKNLVKSKAKAMFLIGGDNDDLIQEGMIGLFMAINYYDPRKDSSFNTFADICITRRLYSAIQASQRKKNSPLNSYISISEDEQQVFDNMHGSFDINPEEMLINRENVRIINEKMKESLSKFENKVMTLYLDGHNYIEIASLLEKSPKSIDNALQRIKKKLAICIIHAIIAVRKLNQMSSGQGVIPDRR